MQISLDYRHVSILEICHLSQVELIIQILNPSYHAFFFPFIISLVISGSKNAILMHKYLSLFIQSIYFSSASSYGIFAFVVTYFVQCQFIWLLHTTVGRKKCKSPWTQWMEGVWLHSE